MRTVRRSTVLAAPADVVWSAVRTPAALVHVAAPVLRFPALEARIRPWQAGESVTTWLLLFGLLPVSRHTLRVESVDDDARAVRSDDHGSLVRSWRHLITVTPLDEGGCRYTDEVEIDAGPLTGPVWLFAEALYRWRQRRWRRLALVLAGARAADRARTAGPGSAA
ncbi:SRPBCC family protein [Geodermatophilus sp. SYSU D00710]